MAVSSIPESASPVRMAFVSGGLGLGGSTTFLCNLGGELVRQGVPVLVLGLENGNPLASDFASRGIPVVTQDERRLIFEDRVRNTLEALAGFQPTAVISGLGASSYEVLRYIPAGVTRVLMVQADDPVHYEPTARYGPYVDAVVGVSEKIRQTLAAMPEFHNVPNHYLTSGVAVPEKFTPRRTTGGSPLRLLYLGRLDRQAKRVHLFPQILRDLVQSGIPFNWNIVGQGPDAAFLAETMRTEKPDQQVRLVGPVAYERVPEILENNDVLLLASNYEGLPLCVLEGMAHGVVPVVTALESGIRELLDDSTGRQVAADNFAGYAEAIIGLYRDSGLMERLSRNARQRVIAEYSTAVMTDRWLKAFPALGKNVEWPRYWQIRGPLGTDSFYFSPPMRTVRRLLRHFRRRSS